MTKIVKETPVDDNISVLVLKRPGEAPYTQVIASKLSRIRKLKKYIARNHGNKRERYQQQLDSLLAEYQKEIDSAG